MEGFFLFAKSLGVNYIFFKQDKFKECEPAQTVIKASFVVTDNNSTIKGSLNKKLQNNQYDSLDIRDLFDKFVDDPEYDPFFIPGKVKILGDK